MPTLVEPYLNCGVHEPEVTPADGTSVKLDAEKVGVPYLAFGTVPDVKFDALRLDKSTCCVIEEADSRASANVPLVIFDEAKSGTSLADSDNRADGTVPDVRLLADSDVKSTCWVTELEESLASAKVPDVIFDADNAGITFALSVPDPLITFAKSLAFVIYPPFINARYFVFISAVK